MILKKSQCFFKNKKIINNKNTFLKEKYIFSSIKKKPKKSACACFAIYKEE